MRAEEGCDQNNALERCSCVTEGLKEERIWRRHGCTTAVTRKMEKKG